jgi:hypothetical protein
MNNPPKRKWIGWKGDDGESDRRTFDKPHPGSFACQELADLDSRKAARVASGLEEEIETVPLPKKKCAVLLGYCGAAYGGMQMNEGVKSIEGELERAIFRSGGIARTNFGNLQKASVSIALLSQPCTA